MDEELLEKPLDELASGGKATAAKAVKLLTGPESPYLAPTKADRWALAAVMAKNQRILYGDAFDLVQLPEGVGLNDEGGLLKKWRELRFFEIKSTSKASVKADWSGYFFSLSTAELLTAQNLRGQYQFMFVNTLTGKFEPMTLQAVFARAHAIYPTWSISFGKPKPEAGEG